MLAALQVPSLAVSACPLSSLSASPSSVCHWLPASVRSAICLCPCHAQAILAFPLSRACLPLSLLCMPLGLCLFHPESDALDLVAVEPFSLFCLQPCHRLTFILQPHHFVVYFYCTHCLPCVPVPGRNCLYFISFVSPSAVKLMRTQVSSLLPFSAARH